jgi:hypothetical protein
VVKFFGALWCISVFDIFFGGEYGYYILRYNIGLGVKECLARKKFPVA